MTLKDIEMKLTYQERFDLFAALCFWVNEKPALKQSEYGAEIIEACRERAKKLRDRLDETLRP